jgi:hypothetical protein
MSLILGVVASERVVQKIDSSFTKSINYKRKNLFKSLRLCVYNLHGLSSLAYTQVNSKV